MSPSELLAVIEKHGATLLPLGGDRLRLQSPEGFPEYLKQQARDQKAELIRLISERVTQNPRGHFLGLAEGYEEVGIIGRLGSKITGELWQAVQGWEFAVQHELPDKQERAIHYWELWKRYFPRGLER